MNVPITILTYKYLIFTKENSDAHHSDIGTNESLKPSEKYNLDISMDST